MPRATFVRRLLGAGACALLLLLPAAASAGASGRHRRGNKARPQTACSASYKEAQAQEQDGHLLAARDTYASCARPACGEFVAQECSARHLQIDNDIPSVVPLVSDESGMPRSSVDVKLDGKLLTSKLVGRAFPMDPGIHELSFEINGRVVAAKQLMAAQGQRYRQITVQLREPGGPAAGKAVAADGDAAKEPRAEDAAKPSAPRSAPSTTETATPDAVGAREATALDSAPQPTGTVAGADITAAKPAPSLLGSVPTASYIAGGAGVVAIGAGVLLTTWGRKDRDELVSSCAPNCAPSSADHVHTLYVASDVSFGVGLAALAGAAGYWIYSRHVAGAEQESAHKEALRFDVLPSASGALGNLSGSF